MINHIERDMIRLEEAMKYMVSKVEFIERIVELEAEVKALRAMIEDDEEE